MNGKEKKAYRKPLIIAAASLAAVIGLSVTVYAWFTNRRSLDTITKINAPVSLSIGAGAKESSVNIDMGGIDVEAGEKKDFVFCVFSDDTCGQYKIQLAHTTNIGFSFAIYKSADGTGNVADYDVLYTDANGGPHYYKKGDRLGDDSNYLNRSNIDPSIADDSLHQITYGEYLYVQDNAEPLYWQSDTITPAPLNSGFLDYYILEVSWTPGIRNNKETDMVYITAGM